MTTVTKQKSLISAPLLVAAAVCAGGCAKQEIARMAVCPVSGSVFLYGKPIERAEVRLNPLFPFKEPTGRSVLPFGRVQADGRFRIGTYSNDDGAPPGEYALTLVWPKITIEGGEENFGPDQFQGRFADASHPLRRITVKEGENALAMIELSEPPSP